MRRPDPHPGPRVRWAPGKVAASDASDAVFLASSYGLTPDDWQEDILQGWLSRRADGKWCHGRCGIAVPRQNGKNGSIEIRELFGMVELGEKFLHTAHEVKTARKAFKRLLQFFDRDTNPRAPQELVDLVVEIRKTNGQEAIVLSNGGSVEFVARSSGSGRGFTVDVLILDEAQHLTDEELEAIRPAVSSAPLGNPQVIYAGTPPNRDKGETGEAWLRVRSLAEKDRRLCWIEYGAPDGPMPDITDDVLLFASNPALELRHANGAYGLQMDVVNDERGDLSPEGVARERYGWWGNPETKHRGVIDLHTWATLKSDAPEPSRATMVIDVSPNLEWATIALGSTAPDGRVLGLVHHKPGTGWTTGKAVEIAERLELVGAEKAVNEVALTPNAQIFAAGLTKAGMTVHLLTNSEIGRGCTALQEWIRQGTVAHVKQPDLDAAVRNASTRYVGSTAPTQHWDQRDRSIDMTPLVAYSVAVQRWAVLTAKPKIPPPPPRRARRPATVGTVAGMNF